MQPSASSFLIVEDEPRTARTLTRVFERCGPTVAVASVREARAHLRSPRWAGLVVQQHLPDGTGLELIAAARKEGCDAKAILLSVFVDAAAINGAFRYDARCLCLPCPVEHLTHFAHQALAEACEVPARLVRAVNELASRHSLTPAQTEILLSTVRGIDRQTIVQLRRVSENTHKTQVRSILRKTRTLSLGELRDQVLRQVTGPAAPLLNVG